MRTIWCAACISAIVAASAVAVTVVDKTVAKVNGEAIFLSELDKNVKTVLDVQKKLVSEEKQTEEWQRDQKKAVLAQMVEDKLLLQEAKKLKIKVNKRDFEDGMAEIKRRFARDEQGKELDSAATDKRFREELQKEGMTQKEFENRLTDQLMVVKLIDQEVKSRVEPPAEEEIKKTYDTVTELMAGKKVTGLSEEEKQQYETLSKYLEERTAERISARHILVKSEPDAPMKDKSAALKKIQDIKKKVDKGEDFAALAKEYSDDTESAARGGALGFFIRGWMVPEFEKAAFALPVGGVSDIVQTEFGYHIIKVEEKRAAQKLRYEDIKNELAEFTFRIKMKARYDLWVSALKKASTIEILDKTLQ